MTPMVKLPFNAHYALMILRVLLWDKILYSGRRIATFIHNGITTLLAMFNALSDTKMGSTQGYYK